MASQACGPVYEPTSLTLAAATGPDGGGGGGVCRLPPTPIDSTSCIFESTGSPPGPVPDGSVFIPGIDNCEELVAACGLLVELGYVCNPVLGGHGIYDVGFRSSDDAGRTIHYIWGCGVKEDGGITRYCPEADECLWALAGGGLGTITVASCSTGGPNTATCVQTIANATGCGVQAANGACTAGASCYGTAGEWVTATPAPRPPPPPMPE